MDLPDQVPYIVYVGPSLQKFTLSYTHITFDSPNLFTSHFLNPSIKIIPPPPLFLPTRSPEIFEVVLLYLSGYEILPLSTDMMGRDWKGGWDNWKKGFERDVAGENGYGLRRLIEKILSQKTTETPIPKSPGVTPLVWCNDDIEPFFDTPPGSQTTPYLRQISGPFDISPRPPPAQNSNFKSVWPDSIAFRGKGLIVADGPNTDSGRPLLIRAKNVQVLVQLDINELCVRVSFKFLMASDRKLLAAKVPNLLPAPTWLAGESLTTASMDLNGFQTTFQQFLAWYYIRTRPPVPPNNNPYAKFEYLAPLDTVIGVPFWPERPQVVPKLKIPLVADEMLFHVLRADGANEGYIVPVWIKAKTMGAFWASLSRTSSSAFTATSNSTAFTPFSPSASGSPTTQALPSALSPRGTFSSTSAVNTPAEGKIASPGSNSGIWGNVLSGWGGDNEGKFF